MSREVTKSSLSFPRGDLVADLACGHGQHVRH
ncbi:MAG: DUF3565 domain-containing protein [Nitrospira sp.]|nr:MAG: DUF3565 domain-containing protein [Nitrospira sp.]